MHFANQPRKRLEDFGETCHRQFEPERDERPFGGRRQDVAILESDGTHRSDHGEALVELMLDDFVIHGDPNPKINQQAFHSRADLSESACRCLLELLASGDEPAMAFGFVQKGKRLYG